MSFCRNETAVYLTCAVKLQFCIVKTVTHFKLESVFGIQSAISKLIQKPKLINTSILENLTYFSFVFLSQSCQLCLHFYQWFSCTAILKQRWHQENPSILAQPVYVFMGTFGKDDFHPSATPLYIPPSFTWYHS